MKCYYSTGDGPWHEGNIDTIGTGMYCLSGPDFETILLGRAEFLFFGERMAVTGYRQIKGNQYQLVSFEVMFHGDAIPEGGTVVHGDRS